MLALGTVPWPSPSPRLLEMSFPWAFFHTEMMRVIAQTMLETAASHAVQLTARHCHVVFGLLEVVKTNLVY